MLDDQQQLLAINRAGKIAHDKTFLPNFVQPEEQVVHIGDIHNETTASQPSRVAGMSPVAGALIGMAIAGIGGPLALLAWQGLTAKPVVPVVNPGIDNDHQYEIRLLP